MDPAHRESKPFPSRKMHGNSILLSWSRAVVSPTFCGWFGFGESTGNMISFFDPKEANPSYNNEAASDNGEAVHPEMKAWPLKNLRVSKMDQGPAPRTPDIRSLLVVWSSSDFAFRIFGWVMCFREHFAKALWCFGAFTEWHVVVGHRWSICFCPRSGQVTSYSSEMMQPEICVTDLQNQALTHPGAKPQFPFPMDSKTAMSDLEDEEMTLCSDWSPRVLESYLGTFRSPGSQPHDQGHVANTSETMGKCATRFGLNIRGHFLGIERDCTV